ncbi:hypothetical protein ACR3K2_34150 [Cryptosporidium serpentis]
MTNKIQNQSILTQKHYWDEFYQDELKSYNDLGIRGEEWFDIYIESIIQWIKSIESINSKSLLLDIGCGNGIFLIDLVRAINLEKAVGIDYIPSAIKLAKKIVNEEQLSSKIELYPIDLLSGYLVSNEINFKNKEIYKDIGTFDVIVDKGTYDVFVMKNETIKYRQSILRYLKSESILIITSCNSTPDELIEEFISNSKFTVLSNLRHKTFSYSGSQGQVLASVAFKYCE